MQVEVVERPECEAASASVFSPHERLHLKNILVPTDFSTESIKPLLYGLALAQQFDSVLWLLHVIEPPPAFAGFDGIPISTGEGETTGKAEAHMAEFAAKHIPSHIAVTSLVRWGSTIGEISALATARNLDLTVISTHGRTGLSRALYGSMAEKILHRAPCPILVVRENEHDFVEDSSVSEAKTIKLNRILVPVDFTDCSKKAVRYAEAFAWEFNAEIHCVHFLEPEKPLIVVETESFRKAHEDEARREMAAQLKQIDPSIRVESAIKSAAPACGIVDLADERKVDLIILGEHSRSGAKRLLLGGTTDEVLKRVRCPTLVVRETEHEFIE